VLLDINIFSSIKTVGKSRRTKAGNPKKGAFGTVNIGGRTTGVTSAGQLFPESERKQRVQFESVEASSITSDARSRHDTHYAFAHILLRFWIFSDSLNFARLDLKAIDNDGKILADIWNSFGGTKAKADDFQMLSVDLQDRWTAIVIKPPPALEPLEAHLIGIWRDLEPNEPLAGEKKYPESTLLTDGECYRYFCLERTDIDGLTYMAEWFEGKDRRNLGSGPEFDMESMLWYMAKHHGIDISFTNDSWDSTQVNAWEIDTQPEHSQVGQGAESGKHAENTEEEEKSSGHPVSVADELKKLAKLHSEGVLTKTEFQTLKSNLISGEQ